MTAGFGIPQLDRGLGVVPNGALLLLLGDPTTDATPFLRQCAATHCRDGQSVVYVSACRPPSQVRSAMLADGFPCAASQAHFVDAYTSLRGLTSDDAYCINDPADVDEIARTLKQAAREHPHAILLIDHLSTILDAAGDPTFTTRLPQLLGACARFRFCVAAFTQWPYGAPLNHMRTRFDATIRLRAIEDRIVIAQSFSLQHANWQGAQPPQAPRLYKTRQPGGIQVYIPKILVTGAYHAGKSSFIHAVSDAASSIDRLGTTVALDRGTAFVHGVRVDLFGTPGQARFDPMGDMLWEQAVGIVLVVDSSQPHSFSRAHELLRKAWQRAIPAIVVANKQDLDEAIQPRQVARLIGAKGNQPVYACNAKNPQQAKAILHEMVECILERRIA